MVLTDGLSIEQGPRLSAMRAWLMAKEGQSPPSLSFGKEEKRALLPYKLAPNSY
ncbi:MAG: hypothetical protein ACPLYX_07170 [Rectinema subterraneum]|uniref:hypothetical protein n=1 Tax=Rectinema subterraneum TaxID=2653714 RepID=UPI003C7BEAAC